MPKVSVIVPCYNVSQYIDMCLDSLVNQTLKDIEIICVDDCGTDDTMDTVRKYAANDKRIKIVKNKQNSGLSESRNNGIRHSSAEYIMCCDSDDFYAPDMCAKMYDAITSENADIGICGTNVIYEADHHMQKSDEGYFTIRHNGTVDFSSSDFSKYPVCAWNKIYRRDIIFEHDVWFPRGLKYEDEFFFPAYCSYVKRAALVSDKLYQYRRRAGSIMNQTFRRVAKCNMDYIKIAIAWHDWAVSHNVFDAHSDWFWINMFLPMLRNTLKNSDRKYHDDIYRTACEFIDKSYVAQNSSFHASRCIDVIRKHNVMPRKYLFGLLRVQNDALRCDVKFAGVSVFKIKRTHARSLYYLFGMRIAKSVNKYTIRIPRTINTLDLDNTQLISVLREMGEFTYIPNGGNIGDMLIASSTMAFFDDNDISYTMYNGNSAPNIVYGGGGIWTSSYERDWSKFLPIFQSAQRVVILPSSFNGCQKLLDILDERFTVFCREEKSYKYLKSANTGAKILLDHDMALRMSPKILSVPLKYSEKTSNVLGNIAWGRIPRNVAYFMRTDCESSGHYTSDMDVSDLAYGSSTSSTDYINFCALLMLTIVNIPDVIVTDRLHVGIAGLLMGKTVYLLDNSYGKLSGVYKNSLKQFKNMHFCTEMPKL